MLLSIPLRNLVALLFSSYRSLAPAWLTLPWLTSAALTLLLLRIARLSLLLSLLALLSALSLLATLS